MYTKEQMQKAFDAGYANADDSYPGPGFDEFMAALTPEPSADVVEPQFGKVYFATVVSMDNFLDSGAFETRQRKLVTCLLGEWMDGRGRRVNVEGPFVGPVTEESFTASLAIITAKAKGRTE